MRAPHLHVGTSGWVYPHWRGLFYPQDLPQSRWFDHYAERFDTVEVNNSFYRLPDAAVFGRWKAQSPAGFIYALKASRYLTHVKRLRDPGEARYAGRYGREALLPMADWVCEHAVDRDVFAYFNNDIGGHAVHDAVTMRALLGGHAPIER